MMKIYISPSIEVITYSNDSLLVSLSGIVGDEDPDTKVIEPGGEYEEGIPVNAKGGNTSFGFDDSDW